MSAMAPEKAPPAQAKGKQQQQVLRRPFIVGTRRVDSAPYDQTKVMTAGTQDFVPYDLDTDGFCSGLYILVVATSTASAAVVFGEDGPFAALDTIVLNDTNNKPLLGPFNGYDLYLVEKYGGYNFMSDPRQDPDNFSTATSGAFSFILRLPIEIVHRDALGSLPNKSSSATYQLKMRLAAAAAGSAFNNIQNALPSVRVRIQQFGWMDPNPVDLQGNPVAQTPPANQTTQIWERQDYTLAFGALNTKLQSIDALVRNLMFVMRDSSASSGTGTTSPRRSGDLNWPDPFVLIYETSTPINRLRAVWQRMIREDFDYTAAVGTAAQDAADARDAGVYPETFMRDYGLKPGAESRFGYLPASAATSFKISGTIGSNGTGPAKLEVLVNKVIPAQGNLKALTGR